jgi:hypothetical protein
MKLVFFDFEQNVNMSTGFCSFLLCDSRVVTCSDVHTDRQTDGQGEANRRTFVDSKVNDQEFSELRFKCQFLLF